MGAYNIVSSASMVAGQAEDISVVLANFQAIQAILNGGLDNSNINAAAAILASKLAGYPADGTKSLFGDGVWKVPGLTTYRKTTPKAVNTSVAATDLLNGEITIAGNVIGPSGVLRLVAWGDNLQNSGGAAAPPRFQLIFGGTTLLDTNTSGANAANATRASWRIIAEIMNLGAANSQMSSLQVHLTIRGNINSAETVSAFATGVGSYQGVAAGADGLTYLGHGVNAGTAVDTTAAKLLELKVINASASANYETRLLGALVEVIA